MMAGKRDAIRLLWVIILSKGAMISRRGQPAHINPCIFTILIVGLLSKRHCLSGEIGSAKPLVVFDGPHFFEGISSVILSAAFKIFSRLKRAGKYLPSAQSRKRSE